MFAFGVSNTDPNTVLRKMIEKKFATNKEVSILPVGTSISTKKKYPYKVLFILTLDDFLKNKGALQAPTLNGVFVVVFASALKLAELNVIPLDYAPNPAYPGYGFLLKPINLQPMRGVHTECVVHRKDGKYLDNLISYVRKGSLLTPLMTFIYTLPSKAQTKVKLAVAKWLFLSKKESELAKILSKVEGMTLTDRVKAKLSDILINDTGRAFQAAFAEYRAAKGDGAANIAKIAKTHGVSDYEMRYIISVIKESEESGKLYEDSFEKARNRNIKSRTKS